LCDNTSQLDNVYKRKRIGSIRQQTARGQGKGTNQAGQLNNGSFCIITELKSVQENIAQLGRITEETAGKENYYRNLPAKNGKYFRTDISKIKSRCLGTGRSGGCAALAVRVGCWRRELGAIKVLEIWGCVYRDSLNGASLQLGKLLFMLRFGHALATALSC
jgi:hypothetical protein